MEENKIVERKVIKISKKKIIRSFVILVIIVVLAGLWIMGRSSFYSVGPEALDSSAIPCIPNPSAGIDCPDYSSIRHSSSYDYTNSVSDTSSISDTREFLKTSYRSRIKTRDVSDVVKEVKNIVKGADGRIDSFDSSEKYGRVSFVVAKSKFDAFKDEMESITHEKLYTENISSQNLLTEKQDIEGQMIDSTQSLDALISQRTELTNTHNKTVTLINKEISFINKELVKVRENILLEKDPQILVSLRSQEASFVEQYGYQKQKLSEENKNYLLNKQNFDSAISNQGKNIDNINKQDDKFMDNIETVSGYVDVEWVSLWEISKIFSPIHPTLIIIILIIIAFVIFRKRMPKVVME